jgi:hypothetical protein
MNNESDLIIAKINQRTTLISTAITVGISIIGSIIVALIVGNLTIKASVEAVKLSNKSQEELLNKTIDSQLSVASQSNGNQLKIAMETIESNQIISEETFKNAFDVISRDNELKIKATIEDEKRNRQSKKVLSLNYFLSDISVRTLYLDGVINGVDQFLEKISESKSNQKGSLRLMSEIEMKQVITSQEMVSWPIPADMNEQIINLESELQRNILLFYRSIEKFSTISNSANGEEFQTFKNGLKKVILSNTASDSEKQLAFEMYVTISQANFSAVKAFLTQIVVIGLRNMVDLQHLLKLDNKAIREKLARYEEATKNQESKDFSSMNQFMQQIDRFQSEILEKKQMNQQTLQ